MAFVFRSERNIFNPKNSQNEINNYNNNKENQIYTNILSQVNSQDNIIKDANLINNRYNSIYESSSPPFLSGAERNITKKRETSPGPGTYNISKGYYNKHRQFSSRQENSKPEEYELFDLPLLRMKEVINDNPGPGYYNPSEKDLFGGKFKNKSKLLLNRNNKSLLGNNSQSEKNYLFRNEKNKNDSNSSLEIKDNINKLIYIYSSKRRKSEKDENLKKSGTNINNNAIIKRFNDCGGELPENFSMKNIKTPLSIQCSENDNIIANNLGMNNNNKSKISGITLDTERTSINSSKLSYSQIRNKSTKLLQNLKNQLNNNQDKYLFNHMATEQNTKINNSLFPTLLKYDKSRIYKNEQNHNRIILSKAQNTDYFMNNISEFDKLLNSEYFSHNPGPGYYDPIVSEDQKYYKSKNNLHNLNYFNRFKGKNVTSLTKNKSIKNILPGPGEYKVDNNMINNKIKIKMNKKMRNILFDIKKIAKLRIIREKEALKRNEDIKSKEIYIEPKYQNNSEEIFNEESLEYRKMHSPKDLLFNFGSNDKRFHDIKTTKPGPGEYDMNLYKSIEEKNANIIEGPSYKELYDKYENKNNLIERTPINKDLINYPAVGTYNPDIFLSIKYNAEYKNKMKPAIIHKSSFNPELEKLTLDKVKEIKEKEKKLISYLGPGRYNNMLNKTFNNMNKSIKDENKPPFGSSEKKLETKKQDFYPGPGQYDPNLYYNWITRTYNILFC